MKKNLLLDLVVTCCKVTKLIVLGVFIAFTFIFIHLQIDKDYYKEKELKLDNLGFTYTRIAKWKIDKSEEDKNVYIINQIKTKSIYILYLQYGLSLILIFMSLSEFQKILTSVKNIKTFEINNELSFRRIGKYVFIYFVLTSYRYISFEFGGIKAITISLTPIIILLIAFIMAEIFKEGMLLKQENELTI